MRRDLMANLALGCAGIFTGGSRTAVALASHVGLASFRFYRVVNMCEWEQGPPAIHRIGFAAGASFGSAPRAGLFEQVALRW